MALVLCAGSLHYAAGHLGVNTNPAEMLDSHLPFRKAYDRFGAEFPGLTNTLLLVIEAPAPEQAHAAAERVRAALLAQPERFEDVDWPAGLDFFQDHGLLLRSPEDLDSLADRLSGAQPMLARLAADPSLVGLFGLLAEFAERAGEVERDPEPIYARIADSLEGALGDGGRPLSWQRLLAEGDDDGVPAHEILLVRPRLDFGRVMAGREAMWAVAALRSELGLDAGPATLRVTGSVALAYEELSSVVAGAKLAGLLALGLVALVMYVGLRSLRLVVVALLSLGVGLSLTLGFAALAVGRVNLVSIAFAVLYIGLGVNYAIYYLLSFRERLAHGATRGESIVGAGSGLLGALALSAITTAIGFYAFIPTAFAGVAELGLIAGTSMLITFAISYSFTPALLAVLPAPTNVHLDRIPTLPAVMLDAPLRHRRVVLAVSAVLGIAALWLLPQLRFDADPLNLRDPESESVTTLRSLLSGRATGYRNVQVLAADGTRARALTAALDALPEVDHAMSLWSFAPEDQDERLAVIDDIRLLLGPDLLAADWRPQERPVPAVAEAVARLRAALAAGDGEQARRLDAALVRFQDGLASGAAAADELARRVEDGLLGFLPQTLGRLTRALAVQTPVAIENLPQSLHQRWVGSHGTWLIQVFPARDAGDVALLGDFVAQVRTLAPDATGMPVLQIESGKVISAAFREALGWALLGIGAVLWLLLRRPARVLKVLLPLLLGGALTSAVMVLTGIPFNFANVIALPLLLGVGVDNGIQLVYRFRNGHLPGGNVLRTPIARGIVFGALTTVLSFGNLMLSPHAGTASMGLVLALGLSLVVMSTLLVLPALLGRR